MHFREATIHRVQSIAVPALAFAGAMEILYLENYTPLLICAIVLAVGTAIALLPPVKLFHLYFIYLAFEGGLKILTSYNPIIHVGSDIVLLIAFFRLWSFRVNAKSFDAPPPFSLTGIFVVIHFLILFWVWVGVQFFNPWGIGLLPSIAGLKVYAIPMLTFLIVSFLLEEKEIASLVRLILILGVVQGVIALIDWAAGPAFLISLSPMYAAKAAQLLLGGPYRPFGTTAVPGTPGIWIFHALISAFAVMHLGSMNSAHKTTKSTFWNSLLIFFVPLGLATLLVCQIRIILIRSILLGFLGLILSGGKRAVGGILAIGGLVLYLTTWAPAVGTPVSGEREDLGQRIDQAIARARSLETLSTWEGARGGSFSLKEGMRRAKSSIMGIGLSRVGASTAPWEKEIKEETSFGHKWGFADSVYLAIFSELGLAGLVAYLCLVGALLVQLFRRRTYLGYLCAAYCFIVLLSGYATEGVLYQPDVSFFWFYGALGLRFRGEGKTA